MFLANGGILLSSVQFLKTRTLRIALTNISPHAHDDGNVVTLCKFPRLT